MGDKMDDITRHNEINKHIRCMETFFDVLQVIVKHNLLGEVKVSSTSYLIAEMEERLEAIKKLYEQTYDVVCYLKKHLIR